MNKKTHWKCPQCNSIIQGNNYHEITEKDLNPLSVIKIQARRFPSYSIFGGLESFDVGKRLYLIDGILYIENKEQYEKRIKQNEKQNEDQNQDRINRDPRITIKRTTQADGKAD